MAYEYDYPDYTTPEPWIEELTFPDGTAELMASVYAHEGQRWLDVTLNTDRHSCTLSNTPAYEYVSKRDFWEMLRPWENLAEECDTLAKFLDRIDTRLWGAQS